MGKRYTYKCENCMNKSTSDKRLKKDERKCKKCGGKKDLINIKKKTNIA